MISCSKKAVSRRLLSEKAPVSISLIWSLRSSFGVGFFAWAYKLDFYVNFENRENSLSAIALIWLYNETIG
jgi:hypothetical protein